MARDRVTTIRKPASARRISGTLRAFKVLCENARWRYANGRLKPVTYRGPYYSFDYCIGKLAKVPYADTCDYRDCSYGINICTLDSCLKWLGEDNLGGWRSEVEWLIGVFEFTSEDVAAVPEVTSTFVDKFRLYQAKLVKVLSPEEARKTYGQRPKVGSRSVDKKAKKVQRAARVHKRVAKGKPKSHRKAKNT